MNRNTRWGLLIAGSALIFLGATFPASFAARLLPAPVALAGVEGSIWNGGATALGVNGLVTQEKLRWKFQPLQLFKGNLVWQINSEHAGQPGEVRAVAGLRGAALENLRMVLPVQPLTQFDPIMTGLRLRGEAMLSSPRISRNEAVKLEGNLKSVGSAMAGELTAIGSYRFTAALQAAGNGTLDVSTISGPLQVKGGGEFNIRSNKSKFRLHLKPETDLPGLSPVLATLPREGDGYLLNYPR